MGVKRYLRCDTGSDEETSRTCGQSAKAADLLAVDLLVTRKILE